MSPAGRWRRFRRTLATRGNAWNCGSNPAQEWTGSKSTQRALRSTAGIQPARRAMLNKLLAPEVAKRVQGRLFFGIRGYEDDPRDLWEFPEVRTWMRDLNAKFPYWFYFMDLGPHSTLAVVAFSLCQYEKVPGGKRIPPCGAAPLPVVGSRCHERPMQTDW